MSKKYIPGVQLSDKKIGIVGGLGPYAGLDLVRKIFDYTLADYDQDHLPLMLYSFPNEIPVRPEFLLGEATENPGEVIGDIMVQMAQAGAKIIGMPCNTAHSPAILDTALEKLHQKFPDVCFVHLIEETVNHLKTIAQEGAKIGLMCTVATLQTRLYQNALERAGFIPVVLNDEQCVLVQGAINNKDFGIKAFSNPVTAKAKEILQEAAHGLVQKDVDVILLGCTEIPLALTEKSLFGIPVVDATSVLAKALIKAFDSKKLRDTK